MRALRTSAVLMAACCFGGCAAGDPEDPAHTGWALTSAPTANDDAYSAGEDGVFMVAAPGVLANDGAPEAGPLAALLVAAPSHGSVNLHADGSFTYTPDANFFGFDTFSYQASDASEAVSGVAIVTIDVLPVNDPPYAQDDVYSTTQNHPLSVPAPGMLSNDLDLDDDPSTLAVNAVSTPVQGGTVAYPVDPTTLKGDGSFSYTPPNGFVGTDSFTYQVLDPNGAVSIATVFIQVTEASPEQQLQDVVGQVDGLVADNVLSPGTGRSLVTKLETALAKLAQGNCHAAAAILNAFVQQVNALVSSGALTVEQGEDLLDAANAILQELAC